MSKSSRRTQRKEAPATDRLYVLANGDASIVVKGWLRAEPLSKELGVPTAKAESLSHAHEMLLELYGHVPESAMQVTGGLARKAPSGVSTAASNGRGSTSADIVRRPAPWLRIETKDGDVLNKTVTDPEQIEGLKALRLWP